jgi:protein O-GlcNAc transferase
MRYLVIHAIPEGMVAVVRHTLHGLLIAEITGRRPVIYWGQRFLYRREGGEANAFPRFFKDVGCCDADAVKNAHGSFLPWEWNGGNVFNDGLICHRYDETRPGVVQPPLDVLLSCEAEVIVYTHWNHLLDIIPFIPVDSVYHGLSDVTIASLIFRKHFKILPDILAPAMKIVEAGTASGRLIGVHCRGSDKISEHALVTPEDYRKEVDRVLLQKDQVFLATDSEAALKKFRAWYGDRLISINCERSSNSKGIHFTASHPEKAGQDFLIDSDMLSKCTVHLGTEGSHVSFFVQAMLKEEGRSFENFVNVGATLSSRIKRRIFHSIRAWCGRNLRTSLRRIQLREPTGN